MRPSPYWEGRDRFIVSKGHGDISLYPILADLGFFDRRCLTRGLPGRLVPAAQSPTCSSPASKRSTARSDRDWASPAASPAGSNRKSRRPGSTSSWRRRTVRRLRLGGVMFAAHHQLDNVVLIVNSNKKQMLGDCSSVLNLLPLEEKFAGFGWGNVAAVNGHDVHAVHTVGPLQVRAEGVPRRSWPTRSRARACRCSSKTPSATSEP